MNKQDNVKEVVLLATLFDVITCLTMSTLYYLEMHSKSLEKSNTVVSLRMISAKVKDMVLSNLKQKTQQFLR